MWFEGPAKLGLVGDRGEIEQPTIANMRGVYRIEYEERETEKERIIMFLFRTEGKGTTFGNGSSSPSIGSNVVGLGSTHQTATFKNSPCGAHNDMAKVPVHMV